MLSDALHSYGENINDETLEILAYGCLSPNHSGQFKAFVKQIRSRYRLASIMKGDTSWPRVPEDRDVLYFLAKSFRSQLIKELPEDQAAISPSSRELAIIAKGLIKDLATISLEIAQMVVANIENTEALPAWFVVEVIRDLPRLAEKKNGS